MTFGENLQYLRDRGNMTQEALAEQLEVSRQSVSKWESGGSFPEMDKLMQMCELFHIDMDTLLRGDVAVAVSEDGAGYDKHMNWFSNMIAGATFLILVGVSIMFFFMSAGVDEAMATALFLTIVAVSVVLYIVSGMSHDAFEKKHGVIQDFYTESEKERNRKRGIICIAGGVAGIVVSVAWLVIFMERAGTSERMEMRLMGLFMLTLAFAVAVIIRGALQSEKCDIAKWNREHDPSPEKTSLRKKVNVACASIMLIATAIFLAIGFGDMMVFGGRTGWSWGWIVYPIGGVLCGLASVIINRNEPED